MRTTAEQPEGMLAGQAARELGVGVQTLHYYEREGLIPPPRRTASGYRVYDAPLVDRVRFVRKAQSLGLTLEDIKEIVGLAERGTCPCGHVHKALAERLKEVDERLKELRGFRAELAALVDRAARLSSDVQRSGGARNAAKLCAIVEEAAPPARMACAQSTAPLKPRRRARRGYAERASG